MRARRLLMILFCAAAAACASRKTAAPSAVSSVPPPPPAIDVAALVRHGCFRCLQRALEAATGEQAYEVATLLTVRAKELGLPYAGYRDKAAALAPPDPAFATYLEAVDAIPADVLSGDRYLHDPTLPIRNAAGATGAAARQLPVAERAAGWRDLLRTGPGSETFRRYLDLAIGCSILPRSAQSPALELTASERDVPVLRYRIGLCGVEPQLF